jgi:phosphoribosylglycinamide formyltransferase-1
MMKLGFLASRNGSSLRAIVGAIEQGRLAAEARLVVSNNRSAPALQFAADQGIPHLCIATQSDPEAADARLCAEMEKHGVELIVLSGYLRQLGPKTLARYRNRVLNIHPGPLPAFGGQGMYGRRVHEAVVAAGAAESGAVIHLVDEIYDHGETVAYKPLPLGPGETAESLEARITAMEPEFFVETLQALVAGRLRLPR